MIYLSKTKHLNNNKVSHHSLVVRRLTEFSCQDIIIKTIEKEKIAESSLAIDFAKKESAVHKQMDHPNIIKVHHTAETDERYILFMEYAGFGSNYLSKKVLLNQKPVREDKLQCWA